MLEPGPSTEISLSSLRGLGDGALLASLFVYFVLEADPWALFSGGDVSHSASVFFFFPYNFLVFFLFFECGAL